MRILLDRDIIEKDKIGRPLLKPFNEKNLTPNGYDLSIKEVRLGRPHGSILELKDKPIIIPPNTHFEIMTLERVECPNDVCASLWIRHSYSKRGVFPSFGKVDAGYCGNLNLNFYTTDEEVVLDPNKRTMVQIVFEQLDDTPAATYLQRSGNYQNQVSLK